MKFLTLLLLLPFSASAGEAVDSKGFAVYTDSIAHLSMDDDDSSVSDRSVPIPNYVITLLKQDEEVNACQSNSETVDESKDVRKMFTAVPMPLQGKKATGIVLLPKVLCVMGANIQGFRIYAKIGSAYKQVFLAYAMSVDVLKTTSGGGYHDIGVTAGSAETEWGAVYRFKSGKYIPTECWQHDFARAPGHPTKIVSISCSQSAEKPYR